jgi:hypothetical protein
MASNDVSIHDFGMLVAYLVPGATALLGVSEFSPTVQRWLASGPADAPTIGGFLYLSLAALAAGMTVSAVRWAVVDTLHCYTGLRLPRLNFAALGRNVEAYNLLIRIHYEHYQFYGNMAIAAAIAYVCHRVRMNPFAPPGWPDLGVALLEGVFLVTSRDTLRLCARPHNVSYVAKLVMWPWAFHRNARMRSSVVAIVPSWYRAVTP